MESNIMQLLQTLLTGIVSIILNLAGSFLSLIVSSHLASTLGELLKALINLAAHP